MRWLSLMLLSLPLSSATVLADSNPIPNSSFEKLDDTGWASAWGRYNWGMEGSDGAQKVDTAVAHTGKNSILGINRTATARGGAYTHVSLAAGSWELSFWAKAAPGETGAVRCYLATAYSRSFSIGDQWVLVKYRHTLLSPVDRAEINIQNSSGKIGTIWFDDVAITPAEASEFKIAGDPRPATKQPRLLYFDAHLMHWADHAAEWKARGFSGAFISGIFGDIHDDPWAADGDPATRGEDDKLLQECRAANEKCLQAGTDSNVLKVAFYADLPDPYDDDGYQKITNNFREAARFARLAKFPCIAIDTEYTAYQFDSAWKGYNLTKHPAADLATKLRERWKAITAAMAGEYPDFDLLVLPEGSIYYGPLWNDLFAGMIDGLIAAKHEQGIHLFCEGSYTMREPEALCEHALDVRETTGRNLPPGAREYWLKSGDVALGAWPLGYYRAITDAQGKFLGWSGRKEVFGDKIVGSYADKSENFPLPEFRVQMPAIRTFSGKYCWIYGHGSAWWQMTPEEDKRYKANSRQHYGSENYLVPTVPNVAEYYKTAAEQKVIVGLQK